MNRLKSILAFALLLSINSYSLECLDVDNSYDIETHWNARENVFVGRVFKSEYFPSQKESDEFKSEIHIEKTFKGKMSGVIDFVSYSTSHGLVVGDAYVFFLPNRKDISDYCLLIRPFEFHWAEREDLRDAIHVREVLNLYEKTITKSCT